MGTTTNAYRSRIRLIDMVLKRLFDILLSITGITLTWWLIAIAWAIASYETKSNGLFMQTRIGRDGKLFSMIKIKTMYDRDGQDSTVTVLDDVRITRSGRCFRKTKIDELPQLINVLLGEMSFVGPRPDVPGFADELKTEDRIILSVRPGITGPASLKYKDEETLLAEVGNPEQYNQDVIYPDKVRINKEYVDNQSFLSDIGYIVKTIFL